MNINRSVTLHVRQVVQKKKDSVMNKLLALLRNSSRSFIYKVFRLVISSFGQDNVLMSDAELQTDAAPF